MGNDKPKALRTIENYLWKALMNMAVGADQHEQIQEFLQRTSNVGDIREIEVLRWFVKSTPYFLHFHSVMCRPTVSRN
jgi:hypothetical protein